MNKEKKMKKRNMNTEMMKVKINMEVKKKVKM